MGSIQSFMAMWIPMTAAMMMPSALPFFVSFARRTRRWLPAAVVAAAVYMLVWSVFGVGVYAVSSLVMFPWPAEVGAALAVAFALAYSLTPLRLAGQAHCNSMCADSAPVPGLGVRVGAAGGLTYGVWCVVCSTGVMVAIAALGMTSPVWIAVGALVVLLFKLSSWRALARSFI